MFQLSGSRHSPIFIVMAIFWGIFTIPNAQTDEGNQVVVVIDYGNGAVESRCVSFSEETITGIEALERSGIPFETEFQAGGAAVCYIGNQGCPADDCFCSCPGGNECVYWSYWHQENGQWSYSTAGSGLYRVGDGAIDGWVWGPGSVTQASPPPVVSFAEVCEAAGSTTSPGILDDVEQHVEFDSHANYTGFIGILLLIGGFFLIVFWRRRAARRGVE